MPSTRAGASDSMPSTAMPSATFASISATPGSWSASASAAGAHVGGEQQLAARRRPEAVLGDLEGALVGDLEPAHLLDRVAPELDADRVLLGRREDVEDAAAHGELAAPLDEVGAGVGGRDEARRRRRRAVARHRVAARPARGRRAPWSAAAARRARARRRPTGGRMPCRRDRGARAGAARRAAGRRCRCGARAARAGSVSHDGKTATRSGGRNAPSAAARSSASRVVAVTTTTGAASGPDLGLLRERSDEERPGAVARRHVDEACATDLLEDVVDIGERPEGGQQRMRHQAHQSRRRRRRPVPATQRRCREGHLQSDPRRTSTAKGPPAARRTGRGPIAVRTQPLETGALRHSGNREIRVLHCAPDLARREREGGSGGAVSVPRRAREVRALDELLADLQRSDERDDGREVTHASFAQPVNTLGLSLSPLTFRAARGVQRRGVVFHNLDTLGNLQGPRTSEGLRGCRVPAGRRTHRHLGSQVPRDPAPKVSGTDFLPAYCAHHHEDPEVRVFLLGAAPGVAEPRAGINSSAADVCRGGLAFSPLDRAEGDGSAIVDRINASGATVLAVGLWAPRPELWIARHRDRLPAVRRFLPVGATLDFQAGGCPGPPLDERGRLRVALPPGAEPRRLWRRYLLEGPRVLLRVGE